MSAEPTNDQGVLHAGDARFVVALAALDLFPRQLNELVFRFGAEAAWHNVRAGRPGLAVPADIAQLWRHRAARVDPDRLWEAHRAHAIGISVLGSPAYPPELIDDPEAPVVLFHRGDLDVRSGPRVAIVGTRRASTYGRDLAIEWGEALSHAGVCVVSGLALGIDGAAHIGALRGPTPPVAVVGSGLDIVYPRRNSALWHEVGKRGLLLTEHPLGGSAAAAHFPARNRILAGLADVVVVIESHEAGGSLITVAAALVRHRTVLAVPGPVHSPASHGTNALIRDGAGVACDVNDILVAVGLSEGVRRRRRETRPAPDRVGGAVLAAFGWSAARLDALAARTGLSLLDTADTLEQLVTQGWIVADHGWFERVARDRVAHERSASK